MQTETGTLVPPRRLGALLRDARVAAGLELEELAARADGLTVVDLEDVEHGRRVVDDAMLDLLASLYGVAGLSLVPPRAQLVIDLDDGRIAIEDADVSTDGATGPDAVLARYLALVYRLRDLPVGTPIGIRDVDVDVLATALEIGAGDVEARLRHLIEDADAVAHDQRRIRNRLVMPVVGVVIATCSTGLLLLVAEPGSKPEQSVDADRTATDLVDAAPVAGDAVAVETRIGTGGAVALASAIDTEIGSPAVGTNRD